jgi:HSP20 family protein
MTVLKFNRPVSKTFNNLTDGFFNGIPSLLGTDLYPESPRQSMPVNIRENEKEYILELVAPGFEKTDFTIGLENNSLTISGEKKSETENQQDKIIRKEYKYQSFKQTFTVDERIDTGRIGANYVNGILTLTLPKKEEVKEAAKKITIQ